MGKKQHYVPRLLLRGFSDDGKSTSLIVLSSGQPVPQASIKEQCYEDFFYGQDGRLEDVLAKQETAVSAVLGDRSVEHLESLSDEDVFTVLHFVHYQRQRTLGTAARIVEQVRKVNAALVEGVEELGGAPPDDDVTLDRALRMALNTAATTTDIVADLGVKFLVSKPGNALVLSDNPVVAANQYLENHPRIASRYPNITGLAARGVQMYLPINPYLAVALYDAEVYQYGSPHKRVGGIGPQDVRTLNRLQVLSAFECLYFHKDHTSEQVLDELVAFRRGRPNPFADGGEIIKGREAATGDLLVGTAPPEVRLGEHLSVVRVLKREDFADYRLGMPPVRDLDAVMRNEAEQDERRRQRMNAQSDDGA